MRHVVAADGFRLRFQPLSLQRPQSRLCCVSSRFDRKMFLRMIFRWKPGPVREGACGRGVSVSSRGGSVFLYLSSNLYMCGSAPETGYAVVIAVAKPCGRLLLP
eukprot:GHVU01127918.1.p1 GENE.GHVU01127918.1~~GHVU01127918.1.p1  ORF type:complete len:104 (-),score=0.78 GHVU01127918.1:101-412(-)